jgi:FkbM family methyltransferase
MTERTPFVDGVWDFWGSYDRGEWEPGTRDTLERFLEPDDLFVDIGAWIGPVSLWAVGLGARVFAFEPDHIAYPQLQANVPSAVTMRVALGRETGMGRLNNPRDFYGDSQSRLSDVAGYPVQVVSVRHAAMAWERYGIPALIKMDIEGGELDVLPALAPYCLAHRVPLFVSWHEDWWQNPVTLDERRAWFEGFSLCEGGWRDFETLLAIP